uniref:CCHC-type domain-containing protein n=1 Tax=Strongyloides papillosus TaxID=174720 RepID=A0A0N5BJV8_STREA
MLTILKLKVEPLGREAIADVQVTSYTLAKDTLNKRFDNRMSIEAAIMELSMARVDYMDARCHHCNFPGHKKSECKRLARDLSMRDYAVEKTNISNVTNITCAVAAPCNSKI